MKKVSRSALSVLLGSSAFVAIQSAVAQETPDSQDERVLGPVVVRGESIPDEKKSTSEISSVLDAEDFQITGDSDIAQSLARVSGLSVSDGKFVIVRGLNERYSAVTINGSPLPSPEPLRRVVPLDLIPTSFLEGALVQKTFSPEYSAEFGGGLVELRTKSVPDEFYLDFGLSIGFDTVTTAVQGLTHDGGDLDFLGFDDGARNLPGFVTDAFFGPGVATAGLDQNALDLALGAPGTTLTVSSVVPPNYGVSTEFGGFLDLSSNIRLGANVALNFGNDFQTREGRREQNLSTTAVNADSEPFSDDFAGLPVDSTLVDFISTTQTVSLNGLSSVGLAIGSNHEITSTTFILRSTLKDTRISQGVNTDVTEAEFFQENFEFFERQVWQTQLSGDHVFSGLNDLSVEWRAAYGEAFRDAPFQRETQRLRFGPLDEFGIPFAPSFSVGSAFNTPFTLSFSDVDDQNFDAGVDFVLPFEIASSPVDLKFGYAYTDKERDTLVREFIYTEGSLAFPDALAFTRNDILFTDVAESDLLSVIFQTNPINLDNAFSTLEVNAAYVGVEAELGRFFRIAAGGRYEDGEQTTAAFSTDNPAGSFTFVEVGASTITVGDSLLDVSSFTGDTDFFLPSVTLTWIPVGDLQIRAGYSQTITRPQFRELTPATFLDDDTDQLIIGNPFLQNTEIDNVDLRLEYYFDRGQFITLGGFYKDITNPIETTSTELGGSDGQTFVNAPSAELYGFEFEFEKLFDLADYFGDVTDLELNIKTNYTFTQSEVSTDGTVVSAIVSTATGVSPVVVPASGFILDGRSLQGQSDHLFNFQIGLLDPETSARGTLLVNWASQRIRQTENLTGFSPDAVAAGLFTPAVVERPPVLVDFVFSRPFTTFGQEWEIELALRNIIGDQYEATQAFSDGSVGLFDVYPLGREFTASVKYRF